MDLFSSGLSVFLKRSGSTPMCIGTILLTSVPSLL